MNEDEAGNLSVRDPDEPSEAGAEGQVHKKVKCLIDKLIFDLPHGYKELGVEAYERQGTHILTRFCFAKSVEFLVKILDYYR